MMQSVLLKNQAGFARLFIFLVVIPVLVVGLLLAGVFNSFFSISDIMDPHETVTLSIEELADALSKSGQPEFETNISGDEKKVTVVITLNGQNHVQSFREAIEKD